MKVYKQSAQRVCYKHIASFVAAQEDAGIKLNITQEIKSYRTAILLRVLLCAKSPNVSNVFPQVLGFREAPPIITFNKNSLN